MKVIKLDRRYNGFPKWKFAVQFSKAPRGYANPYYQYCKLFTELHGPAVLCNPEWNIDKLWSVNRWIYNENWKDDYDSQRIYFNNQADISMITLKLAG